MDLGFEPDATFLGRHSVTTGGPNLAEAIRTIRLLARPGEEEAVATLRLIAMIQHGVDVGPCFASVEAMLQERMRAGIRLGGQQLGERQLVALVDTPEGYADWVKRQHG